MPKLGDFTDIHIDLFHKMILPILIYGCEVWGYANLEKVEIFFRKFLKRVLWLGKSTPNCVVYGETGTYPISLGAGPTTSKKNPPTRFLAI